MRFIKKYGFEIILVAMLIVSMIEPTFAESTSQRDITKFMRSIVDFLQGIVSPVVAFAGILFAGISFFNSNQDGFKKGAYAVGVAAFIALAATIVKMIFGLAGVSVDSGLGL